MQFFISNKKTKNRDACRKNGKGKKSAHTANE